MQRGWPVARRLTTPKGPGTLTAEQITVAMARSKRHDDKQTTTNNTGRARENRPAIRKVDFSRIAQHAEPRRAVAGDRKVDEEGVATRVVATRVATLVAWYDVSWNGALVSYLQLRTPITIASVINGAFGGG